MNQDYYDPKVLRKLQLIEIGILKDFDKICNENNLDYFLVGGSAIGAIRHKGFIPWDDDIDVGMSREDYDKFLKIVKKEYSKKYSILNNDTNNRYPAMNTRLQLKGTTYKTIDFKDIPGEFGIFLDIYSFDNIPDDDKLMKKQATKAWFYGKLMVLSGVKKPTIYYYGIKAKILHMILFVAHYVFKIFHISTRSLYCKARKYSTMYNNEKTSRFAFMFDPKRYTSILSKDDVYPTKRIEFEGMKVKVPNRIEVYLKKRYGDYMKLPPVDKRHNHPPDILKFDDSKDDK